MDSTNIVIFIAIFAGLFYVMYSHYNEYLSDYNRSLFFLLQKKSLLIIVVFFILPSFYSLDYFNQLVVPSIIIILLDLILLDLILPYIKLMFLNIKFYKEDINKDTLLNYNYKKTEENELKARCSIAKPEINYIFSIPATDENIENTLKKYVNYLWLNRLYQKNKMKYFSYILFISLTIILFYIIIYLYYKNCINLKLELKGNTYFIIFTISWLMYSIVRIKTLVGFEFFQKFIKEYRIDKNNSYILKYLTIYTFNEDYSNISVRTKYSNELNKKHIENLEKTINYFIAFLTTVIIMVIIALI